MKHTVAIDYDKYFGEYGLTEEVTEIKLNELKKHKETFFRISLNSTATYIVCEYDRARKGYYCENYETGNERFFKANKTIYIGFIF